MTPKASIRPGGRSRRIQVSVHHAVHQLLGKYSRERISVPLIAEKAGVTPSTIYRRWGSLDDLLSDVATESLRPEKPPRDTGSIMGDLEVWAGEFYEEMSSQPGHSMIRDVLAGDQDNARSCSDYAADQIGIILHRARNRGEETPSVEQVLDVIVAPVMYRILFRPHRPAHGEGLVQSLLQTIEQGPMKGKGVSDSCID